MVPSGGGGLVYKYVSFWGGGSNLSNITPSSSIVSAATSTSAAVVNGIRRVIDPGVAPIYLP